MIPVTKPFLAPYEEYTPFLKGIWERNYLTNNGPLVQQLEQDLKKKLDCDEVLFLTNGTVALQIAIKALDLKGEIITTPFSYVATTSSIQWENCESVFADIEEGSLNIDPTKIEAKITDKTTAILATHVYGNMCDVDAIQAIADKHNLAVIYDGAHAFGVRYKGKSIFQYGDISTTSFHATKLFHTVEGGAVFTSQANLAKKMGHMRNFGHNGEFEFAGVGINGKNSEFHAAMGLVNLPHVDKIIARRKHLTEYYDKQIITKGIRKPSVSFDFEYNYAYYPVIFESEKQLENVIAALHREDIMPRRYFYPSLSKLDYVKQCVTPVSDAVSSQVLCLPFYHVLEEKQIDEICSIILKAL